MKKHNYPRYFIRCDIDPRIFYYWIEKKGDKPFVMFKTGKKLVIWNEHDLTTNLLFREISPEELALLI